MDLFKRTKKIKDERVEHVRNKIYKEMYHVILAICLVSALFKLYKYGAGSGELYLEFVIIIAGGLYYLARSIFLGVLWDEVEIHDRTSKTPMSRKTIFGTVALALIIATILGVNSAVSYADSSSQGLWYFVLVSFVSVMIYLPILLLFFGGIYLLAKKIGMKNSEDNKKL
ncbi:putative Abi (CAAX) family protease [Peribacillus simplex]